jgi:hypothetical protein
MRFADALAIEIKRVRASADAGYEDSTSNGHRWTAADQAWYDRGMARDAPRLRRYNRRNGKPKKFRNQGPMQLDASPYEAGMQRLIQSYNRHRSAPKPKDPPRPLNMSTPARQRRAAEAAARASEGAMYQQGLSMPVDAIRNRTPDAPTRAHPKRTFRTLTVNPFPRNAQPGTRAFRAGQVPRTNTPSARLNDGDPRFRPSYVRRQPGAAPLGPRYTALPFDRRAAPTMGADGILRDAQPQRRRPRTRAKSFGEFLELELKAKGF